MSTVFIYVGTCCKQHSLDLKDFKDYIAQIPT